MAITASMVKELREITGSGMMECKRALQETDGDIEAAVDHLRKSGQAKAGKKASRIAAEGTIKIEINSDSSLAAIVEINCETDFAGKDANFQAFSNTVVNYTLNEKPADIDALRALKIDGASTIDETRNALIAKIGENINVRRFALIENKGDVISSYSHGGSIGVVVNLKGGDESLAKDIAMHIAATNPLAISEDDVSADVIQKEKEIFSAQAAESGKPAEIIEKMVSGRIRKYLAEITLNGQPFVKDPDTTVGKLLDKAGAKILSFTRFEVGEGIEKKVENFAEEVMAQVKGSSS